jgi:hypothetical protein
VRTLGTAVLRKISEYFFELYHWCFIRTIAPAPPASYFDKYMTCPRDGLFAIAPLHIMIGNGRKQHEQGR